MKVTVYRCNPEEEKEPYYNIFQIPITKEEKYTLMDVLVYIRENCDSSLSFFSHSACNHGICGRCAMEVNGKVKLACTYIVEDNEIVVKPKKGNIIKDLVSE